MDVKGRNKGESSHPGTSKPIRTVMHEISDDSDNDSMIIKQPLSNRDKEKKNPSLSTTRRPSTPNDKMRLFMDHAQRTVDQKKWPGTLYNHGDLSSSTSASMLSSPRGTPNHLRQGMYFSVQSLPSHVDASKLQNQPESMPSNSGIPPSSVSTMQTMISVQGPSLPPEFQQSIPDLPSKSIPEIPSVLKEPSSLSTTRHNSVDDAHPTVPVTDSFLSVSPSEEQDETKHYRKSLPVTQRRHESRHRTGSVETHTTTDSVIVNRSSQTLSSDLSDGENDEFVSVLKEGLQQADDVYSQCQESCEQFLCDETLLGNVIERIDTKDSEERKKLNLVLRNRFDRIVDEQIEEINETLMSCEHELKVIQTTKQTSQLDSIVSFIFNSFIEGLSLIGFLPLTILSFIKHILMMFIEDNGKQTSSIESSLKQKKSLRYVRDDEVS